MKLKRILALILCACMVLSTMSFNVFAEEAADDAVPAVILNAQTEAGTEKIDPITGDTISNVLALLESESDSYALDGGLSEVQITLNEDIVEDEVIQIKYNTVINGYDHKITSSASRVIRVTDSNINVTLNDVNMVSEAVRVGTNDIRGISIDGSLTGVVLTLNDCSVDFTDESADDWSYAVNIAGNGNGHTIDINGGSYEGANVINIWGNDNVVSIDGATLTSIYAYNELYTGVCVKISKNSTATVSVSNTTFNGDYAVKEEDVDGNSMIEIDDTCIDNTKSGDNGSNTPAGPAASLDGVAYPDLQSALNEAYTYDGNVTITLLKDFTGNIEIDEKVGLYLTIDGADKTVEGSIKVNALSDVDNNRRTTIKNINFVDNTAAKVDFISAGASNHYPHITVENCDFEGSGDDDDVAVRLKDSKSVVIKNCTGTGLHSFLQNTAGWDLTIENVTVADSKSGMALGTVQGVTVEDCDIDVKEYGIRLDALYNNEAVIADNNVDAFIPVVVRKAEVDTDITFEGENTMTASNTDGIWCAIGKSEYEVNGVLPTAPEANVNVVCEDTALTDGIYGHTSLNGIVPTVPAGSVTFCYTGADTFWGEASANSENAFVIKLYEDDKMIASASLNNIDGIIDGDVNVTWNIPFAGSNDAYWNVEWTEGYPKYDMNPTAVKLFSDGVEVAENVVRFNAPDDLNKIVALAEDAAGNVKAYASLADAVNSAEKVFVVRDTTLAEDLTLPADITFNGNGKNITGKLVASGNVTFAGYTKVSNFDAGYDKPVITIGKGASLELTGTGRMVIGHGATFNITGEIENAKTATLARTPVTPSLIMPGASFTGAGVNFNVENAYIKFTAYCSSKNSNANGTHNFNITNSIWEQAGSFVFSAPTNGMDPTFNLNVKDSVMNTASHLVFSVTKGEIVIDNSIVNEGNYRQLENRSSLTIKNGSVVYAAVNTSENSKNPGTTIVDNATYMTKGNFSGADLGTGTLVVKNGATFTTDKVSNANVTVDATSNFTAADIDENTANVVRKGSTLTGAGTAEDPFIIADLMDLKFFRDAVNNGNTYAGKYVKLTADIDLEGEEWTPIGYMGKTFKGNFDGGNKTIKNLVITKTLVNSAENNGIGFFGRTDDSAVIMNLTIENADITGSLYVGAVVGMGYTGKKIENVTVKGDIAIDTWWYAGVIGGNGYMSLVNNCHVIGNDGSYIKGNNGSYIGGIWGFRGEGANDITNCTVTNLDISGVDRVGGIAGIGHYGNTVSNCKAADVTVTATDPEATTVGLVVGATQGTDDSPTVITGNNVEDATAQVSNGDGTYTVVENLYGTNISGGTPVTNNVAKIGSSYYETLEAAFKAATSGCEITLLADVTTSGKWDCRYNGAKFLVPVTINGNGKTIKFTGEVSDMNWNTIFRFEDVATVKDLTIDISGATGAQRAISSKLDITVDNVTIIGNNTRYGIIFGESAGAAISGVTATITNCEVTDCVKGVSDNANGQDAKAVTITDSTFTNASVVVSAAETATFTGNTMNNGYVDIRAYGVDAELSVVAKDNTLDANAGNPNQILAKTIDAQDGFDTPVAIAGGVYYTGLQSAIDKASNGATITILSDMTLVDTTFTIPANKALTLDLNGKKITVKENKAAQNSTGNYELFYNLGNLTVTGNGSIELTATVNRYWNAMSTIFHNRGGVLTIENGTFTHNGGTDMAYVVDNSANYSPDATTNIKGGSLSSTYIAIRNRMDKHTSNGGGSGIVTLNVSGGEIYGYKRGIWGQASSIPCIGNIAITDGTITSVLEGAVVVATSEGSAISTEISGGTFSSDVSAFLVDGASISKNNDGTYGVVSERVIEVVASEEEVVAGREFTVDVKLAKGENIFNAEWTLSYDTLLFELKGAANTGSIKEIASKTLEGEFFAEGETLATYTFVAKAVPATITGNFTLSETTASTFAESRDAIQVAATTIADDVTIIMIEYDVTATLNGEDVDLTVATPSAETTYTGEAQQFVVSTNLPANVDCEITYTVDGNDVEEVVLTDVGTYEVVYTITTADGYAEKTGKVTIEVKAPAFVVETAKWTVMGKKLVLVYTNQDAMYFTYDDKLMIDVTSKGYEYENNTRYAHVFAFVTDELANDVVESYKEKVMYISEAEGLFILTDGHSKADINFSNTLNVQDISVEFGIVNLHSEVYGDVKYQKHLLKGDINGDKIVNGRDTSYVVSEVKTAMGIK